MTDSKILFIYPGESRQNRLQAVASSESPEDFFYGYVELQKRKYNVEILNSRRKPKGFFDNIYLNHEIIRNRITNIGLSRVRVKAISNVINDSKLAISFTDWFSINMGLYAKNYIHQSKILLGGFHGLSDLPEKAGILIRPKLVNIIKNASKRLNHMFFFGEADRQESIKRYNLLAEKTSLYPFGIDTEFWTANNEEKKEHQLLSVGSDPARDYETLVEANINIPTYLITRLKLDIKDNSNIKLVQGSFYGSNITDIVLRDLYRKSAIVIVPLKDVYQPTGYSVTLQAMACGNAVILSEIKGLWDSEVFINGHNCILVRPGSVSDLKNAVEQLISNKKLRSEIGKNARETAVKHFSVKRMNEAIVKLIDKYS